MALASRLIDTHRPSRYTGRHDTPFGSGSLFSEVNTGRLHFGVCRGWAAVRPGGEL